MHDELIGPGPSCHYCYQDYGFHDDGCPNGEFAKDKRHGKEYVAACRRWEKDRIAAMAERFKEEDAEKKRKDSEGHKYRFMTIRQDDGEVFEGKPVFRIFNNKSGAQLGILSYYKPWKQYVLSSQPECVFNDGCLRDILDFMGRRVPKVEI